MPAPIHFAMNDTSWSSDGLIIGGQGDLYLRSVWTALDRMGVKYTVDRQPRNHAVNVYMNNRDRYRATSYHQETASVHVSHGIADKRYRDNAKTRSYTHIVVPGPAFTQKIEASGGRKVSRWRNRHLGVGHTFRGSRVLELGYPKLDPLFNGQVDDTGVWSSDSRIKVLYAPTHGGGSEAHRNGNRQAPGARATSWWHRDEIMGSFDPSKFEVVLSPHPRHSPGHLGTFEQYVGADVVVADGGSTIYESLVLGKPVVLPSWLTRGRNVQRGANCRAGTIEQQVYVNRIGLHASCLDDMPTLATQAKESGVSSRDAEFAETIVPTSLRGSAGRKWATFLVSLSDGRYGTRMVRRSTTTVNQRYNVRTVRSES